MAMPAIAAFAKFTDPNPQGNGIAHKPDLGPIFL